MNKQEAIKKYSEKSGIPEYYIDAHYEEMKHYVNPAQKDKINKVMKILDSTGAFIDNDKIRNKIIECLEILETLKELEE